MTEAPNDPAGLPQQVIAELQRKLDERTAELDELIAQQTATADVLKAISRSAFDLEAVLTTLTESAKLLCSAAGGVIFRREGDVYRFAASTMDVPHAYREHEQKVAIRADRGTLIGRVALERGVVQVTDAWTDPEYREKDEARLGNVRAMLGVPLMLNGEPIGAFGLSRREPVPFTQRQVELVTTFADQAVIAIENARLFEEVQAKTRDLSEALQQQTATADVLKVISRSTFDVRAVLKTLVELAARLCQAENVQIFLRDGEVYRLAAHNGFSPEYQMYVEQHPISAGRGTLVARTALEVAPVHIPDVLLDPEYTWHEGQKLAGFRAMLGVPLLREGSCIGVMAMTRTTPRPFTTRQTELVTTFADQAVIAIENVRLFDEVQAKTRELTGSLQQQTATADVLKVISRSTFDLQTVLQTLVESAARLCDADKATITREKDGQFYRAEIFGYSDEFLDYVRDVPVLPERGSCLGRALLEGMAVHIPDVLLDPEYTFSEGQRLGGFRTMLGVPMLREGIPIGVVALTRSEPRPFTDKQIELVTTFADQAAIAIENVRLFESVEARTRELARSLEDLRTAQDRLVQTEKLASLGQLTAGIAHEIKNPLNFVNNFSALSAELTDELNGVLKPVATGRQGSGRSGRIDRYAKGQPRKGRPAWQARQLHREEHVAALSPRFRRAPSSRYQCDRR